MNRVREGHGFRRAGKSARASKGRVGQRFSAASPSTFLKAGFSA